MIDMPTHSPGSELPGVYEIARDILAQMPSCMSHCSSAIQSMIQTHTALRSIVSPRIAQMHTASTVPLSAVDGTHEVIESSGITMMLLVAVAVRETSLVDQRTRVLILPPLDEASVLAADLRTRLELGLLAESLRLFPDTLTILDGSLVSIYLTLRRLLRRHSTDQRTDRPDWWSTIPDLLDRQMLAIDWRMVLEHAQVLAHPKRVTTRDDLHNLAATLSMPLLSDSVLWSSILREGEYTHPSPLMSVPARVPETFWGMPQHDRTAISAAHKRWRTLYARFRPYGPALRLEIPECSTTTLMTIFTTVQAALQVAEIMEPLPQFLADALCKAQRQVLDALVQGVQNGLRQEWDHELVALWMGEFRSH